MSDYRLQWITEDIAAGHAPMSYTHLEAIREAGITAIVNLCGEYCDLHEIQEKDGFQVHYLPIPDECAPDEEAMENAILWMNDLIRQNKKILVHCRFGIGRTGTFLMAYFLNRGLDMKAAEKMLKKTAARPAKYCQWKMLRKYKKKLIK